MKKEQVGVFIIGDLLQAHRILRGLCFACCQLKLGTDDCWTRIREWVEGTLCISKEEVERDDPNGQLPVSSIICQDRIIRLDLRVNPASYPPPHFSLNDR